jgi:hypothetical protein
MQNQKHQIYQQQELKNTAEDLEKYILKEVKINDKNHPVKYNGTAEDLKLMAGWLASLKSAK